MLLSTSGDHQQAAGEPDSVFLTEFEELPVQRDSLVGSRR